MIEAKRLLWKQNIQSGMFQCFKAFLTRAGNRAKDTQGLPRYFSHYYYFFKDQIIPRFSQGMKSKILASRREN